MVCFDKLKYTFTKRLVSIISRWFIYFASFFKFKYITDNENLPHFIHVNIHFEQTQVYTTKQNVLLLLRTTVNWSKRLLAKTKNLKGEGVYGH